MGVLRVRDGGQWVDVGGGSDPIWVSPTAPTDPNYEMWYDTDATSFDPLQLAPLGRVGIGPNFDTPTVGTTKLVAGALQPLQMNAGRKYLARLELSRGWYGSVGGDTFTVGLEQDGVYVSGVPLQVTTANAYLTPGSFSLAFTPTTGTHTYQAYAVRNGGTGILQFRGQLFIYDEGPV